MIDTGHPVRELIIGGANLFSQVFSGVRHTVAQSDIFNFGVIVNSPGNHRHRVGIIDEPCVRAKVFHIAADIQYRRDVARSVKNTAGASGIPDVFIDAVFYGDFMVCNRSCCAANPYRDDNVVGIFKSFTTVGGGLDFGGKALLFYEFDCKRGCQLQRFLSDVHQCNRTVSKFRVRNNIRNKILGKGMTSGAN